MVLESVQQIKFPVVRQAYIAHNYFGTEWISHILHENQTLEHFYGETLELLSSYSSTPFVDQWNDSLLQLGTTLLSDSEVYETIYAFSITTLYDSLEQWIQTRILSQPSSSSPLSKIVDLWTLWSTELLSTSFFMYSIREFQMILNMFQTFYTNIQQLLFHNYNSRISFQCHLDPLHLSILYCSSNIYYLQNIKTHLIVLIDCLELNILKLQSNQSLNSLDRKPMEQRFPSLLTALTGYSNNRYSLWKTTTSWFSQLSTSVRYNALIVSDTTTISSIYADGDPPQTNTTLNAWSYTNRQSSRKINWYYLNNTQDTVSWSNLRSTFWIVQFHSIARLPFLTVYTKNNLQTYWYGKRKNYTGYSSTPPLNQWVFLYYGSDPTVDPTFRTIYCPDFSSKIQLQYESDPINFKTQVGGTDLNSDDSILTLTLSTDSSANVETLSFSVFAMGFQTSTQTVFHRTCSSFPSLTT